MTCHYPVVIPWRNQWWWCKMSAGCFQNTGLEIGFAQICSRQVCSKLVKTEEWKSNMDTKKQGGKYLGICHLCPIFTPPFLQICDIVCKEQISANPFFSSTERQQNQKYLGHPCHSTNQQNITYVTFIDISISQTFLAWLYSPLYEVCNQGFKLGSSEFHGQVFWTTGIHCDIRQINVCLQKQNRGASSTLSFCNTFVLFPATFKAV